MSGILHTHLLTLFYFRLRLLSRDGENKTTPPRADSMLQLLLQGLNNKDRKILDSVLDRADEELIEKTVRKLPVEAVLPLITELQHYIKVKFNVFKHLDNCFK